MEHTHQDCVPPCQAVSPSLSCLVLQPLRALLPILASEPGTQSTSFSCEGARLPSFLAVGGRGRTALTFHSPSSCIIRLGRLAPQAPVPRRIGKKCCWPCCEVSGHTVWVSGPCTSLLPVSPGFLMRGSGRTGHYGFPARAGVPAPLCPLVVQNLAPRDRRLERASGPRPAFHFRALLTVFLGVWRTSLGACARGPSWLFARGQGFLSQLDGGPRLLKAGTGMEGDLGVLVH